jgi:DNA-binding response OmpR family regulator
MKILLVEDDRNLAVKLARDLSQHLYAVDIVEDGETGSIVASSGAYDLILLDIVLPKMDGISVCRQLRESKCNTPIILLTAKSAKADTIEGLNAGADDYAIKPYDLQELLARMNALLRRDRSAVVSTLNWGNLSLNPFLGEVACDEKKIALTPNEYRILELLLRNPQKVFDRATIIDRVWTFDEPPTDKAVTTHIKDLRSKLRQGGIIGDPIETVYGFGYRLATPPTSEKTGGEKNIETTTDEPANLERVIAQYKTTFIEQLEILSEARTKLQQKSLELDLRHRAGREAHKMAGSLGIFGYPQGSRLARTIELLLEGNRPLERLELSKLQESIDNLQEELTKEPLPIEGRKIPLIDAEVLVVDDDILLGRVLQIEGTAWGVQIDVAAGFVAAREKLAHNLPDAVLLSLQFPDIEDNGLAFLAELKHQFPALPVIFFTNSDELPVRLEASHLGATKFLNKSLPLTEIFHRLSQIILHDRVERSKVTLFTKDEGIARAIAQLLESWSIDASIIENVGEFWQVLSSIEPDLLVLDLEANDRNSLDEGLELCRIVRQDAVLDRIQIIALTKIADPQAIQNIFAAGADDVLHKPVDYTVLVNRILSRLERNRLENI